MILFDPIPLQNVFAFKIVKNKKGNQLKHSHSLFMISLILKRHSFDIELACKVPDWSLPFHEKDTHPQSNSIYNQILLNTDGFSLWTKPITSMNWYCSWSMEYSSQILTITVIASWERISVSRWYETTLLVPK